MGNPPTESTPLQRRIGWRPTSLSARLVAPTAALLVAAVVANLGFACWLAANRASEAAREREHQVAAVLRHSKANPSPTVLRALQQRTGDEFVLWDSARGTAIASTLPNAAIDDTSLRRGLIVGRTVLDGGHYRVGEIRLPNTRPSTLLVLAPLRPFADAIGLLWPFLAMAVATLAVLVPLGFLMARSLAATLGQIDRHVERISRGEFGHALPLDDRSHPSEIRRLVAGVNHMSATLATLERSLAAGERQRLLGQVAAGFAHELRNAITGASLAIDLHRRRCPLGASGGEDESLAVARSQLEVVEEEVRGLLAVGKPVDSRREQVPIATLFDEVRRLLAPRCDHAGVRLESAVPPGIALSCRRESLRAALLNLALNGIDAAGSGGIVRLTAARSPDGLVLSVSDTGRGPPESIRDSIREPFVTGKPEGIGLGLVVADAVAAMHGGSLEWRRQDGMTVFEMRLPEATLVSEIHPRERFEP